ncbi:hypothetical protein K7432_002220 [Basidiobolus ranarum]|uniref:Uncharacterized protein n=1 Tax=Basidiobolus ranarum TaxID=34480 RepID=A0ABR2X1W2_9FUNG
MNLDTEFRNPSPPPLSDLDPLQSSITGILLSLVTKLESNTVDEIEESKDVTGEDSPFELTLCSIWDLSNFPEYAIDFQQWELDQLLLRTLSVTKRPRTVELVFGIFSTLVCQISLVSKYLQKNELVPIVLETLRNTQDPKILTQCARFLKNILSTLSTSEEEEAGVPEEFITLLNSNYPTEYLLFIVSNSLDEELKNEALKALKWLLLTCEPQLGPEEEKALIDVCIENMSGSWSVLT